MILIFEDIFDNVSDFISSCNKLLKKKLIETNTKLTEDIQTSSHIRITSSGLYYLHNLANRFVYIDLILFDTPIDSDECFKKIFEKTIETEKYQDFEKKEKTLSRLERSQIFVEYLVDQEKMELCSNVRIKNFDDFKDLLTESIYEKFISDKEYILNQSGKNIHVDFEQELLNEEDVEQRVQADSPMS